MKTNLTIILTIVAIYLCSCSSSPTEKAQTSVREFLKQNLKNPDGYSSISFSVLDTLKKADTSETKQISFFQIIHNYEIINSVKEKVKISAVFLLDADLKVTKSQTKSLNGEYGALKGNVYWKYNNYVGDKADAGAKVLLYALDSIRGNLKYETTADVQGNYRIEKILPGRYFLIVRSKNATDCPERHIKNLVRYAENIKYIFSFDIDNYKNQLKEINSLDSLYTKTLINSYDESYRGLSERIRKYSLLQDQMREKSAVLIASFPVDFIMKFNLFGGYSNANDFSVIVIDENNDSVVNTDFGITCI